MSSTAGPLGKKESPTENRRHYNTKRVGKSGDFFNKKTEYSQKRKVTAQYFRLIT
jgi:hypothetical protein